MNRPHALIQLSKHTFVYRGFTIHKCPRHSETSRTAYQLMSNGDFALAEAMRTVDNMVKGRDNK
jgi:hypothetical protein